MQVTPKPKDSSTTSVGARPLNLVVAFMFPMLMFQIFGSRHVAELAESWIFPIDGKFGVAQLRLAPLRDPNTKQFPVNSSAIQLLLFAHNSPDQEKVTLIEASSKVINYPAISAGFLGSPALTGYRESPVADPRPLFDVELPPRTLFAAALTVDMEQGSQTHRYQLVSGSSATDLEADTSTLVAMTRNEYLGINLLWSFGLIAAAWAGKFLPEYAKLIFPGDPEATSCSSIQEPPSGLNRLENES